MVLLARLTRALAIVTATTTSGAPGTTLTFSPPELVTGEFSSSGTTSIRPSGGKGDWIVTVLESPDGTMPFVTMPDGSLHDAGTAGHGSFSNTTSSTSNHSTTWRANSAGDVVASAGPAASFTGLPSALACKGSDPPGSPGDCMYGAGWAAWAQAARLGDGTYVTSTAMVWLGGHFGVKAAQAGLYVWKSTDSYNWEFASRAAAVADMPGFPAWFGPCEGPNEHDSESSSFISNCSTAICSDPVVDCSGPAGGRQDTDDCHPH